MSLKKKICIAVVAIGIAILIGSFYNQNEQNEEKSITDKEVTIIIVNEITNETLYDEVIATNAQTLEELLREQIQLQAVMETGDHGKLLTSLMNLDQVMQSGPWWMYDSETNKMCGQVTCPAVDKVVLFDKDVFTFIYVKEMYYR